VVSFAQDKLSELENEAKLNAEELAKVSQSFRSSYEFAY
jgi:hypothetical protein